MNVSFSPTICEEFLNKLVSKSDYEILRQAAKRMGVPSLEENACQAVTNIVSIKQPVKSIDIGCGIGVSSMAVLKGFPKTTLSAVDSNLERGLFFQNYFFCFFTHYITVY